ncbi:unnamed protein product [Prorocentrum cordatum]|uniref:Uncharacterized protein n=1 Tax=Prorocentrum cordatum TaxID=2364126 RepID=A0ABN9X3D8_9DINO|nr:unnamed protein product [Polarella glacialis]
MFGIDADADASAGRRRQRRMSEWCAAAQGRLPCQGPKQTRRRAAPRRRGPALGGRAAPLGRARRVRSCPAALGRAGRPPAQGAPELPARQRGRRVPAGARPAPPQRMHHYVLSGLPPQTTV